MTLWRFGLIAALVAALALLAVQTAGANGHENGNGGGTRSLSGEELLVQDVTLSFDCDPTRVSTVQFSASGPATGPYPGAFTAHGTVTIAPQTLPGPRPGTVAGPLLSLSETFSITSALGNVTGKKRLPLGLPFDTSQGECQAVTNFFVGNVEAADGTVVDISSQPRYQATIHEPGRTFHDRGDALFFVSEIDVTGTCPLGPCHLRQAAFDQGFISDPTQADDDGDQGENNDEDDD